MLAMKSQRRSQSLPVSLIIEKNRKAVINRRIHMFLRLILGDNKLVLKVNETIPLFAKWNCDWNELIKHHF